MSRGGLAERQGSSEKLDNGEKGVGVIPPASRPLPIDNVNPYPYDCGASTHPPHTPRPILLASYPHQHSSSVQRQVARLVGKDPAEFLTRPLSMRSSNICLATVSSRTMSSTSFWRRRDSSSRTPSSSAFSFSPTVCWSSHSWVSVLPIAFCGANFPLHPAPHEPCETSVPPVQESPLVLPSFRPLVLHVGRDPLRPPWP